MNNGKFTLVKTGPETIDVEMEIVNSNKEYNVLSKDKEELTLQEVLQEIQEAEDVGAERYLIVEDGSSIGITEILMHNPRDGYAWIGLFIIKQELHHKGFGTRALNYIFEVLRERQVPVVRLGVIIDNELGHRFWIRQGFRAIEKKMSNENKEVMVYDKEL
ncbi:Acetyltransferase (GNAT) family protein [compost metagenome]